MRTQGNNVIPFPAFSLPSLPRLNDWLHFNLEAGNHFTKFILMLQPSPLFSGDRVSPLDTPVPLLGLGGESRSGAGAAGVFRGARSLRAAPPPGPARTRLGARPGWTRGPTPGGRRSAPLRPRGRPRAPSPIPRRPRPQSRVIWGRGVAGRRCPARARRRLSAATPALPACTAPPPLPLPAPAPRAPRPAPRAPLQAPPRRPGSAGPSASCPRPRPRRREPPGRTRSPRRAEGGEQRAGPRAPRGGGRGWACSSARPHPTPSTPPPAPASRGRARAGPRSEVGGRRGARAESRVGEGGAEAACGAVVSEPRGPGLFCASRRRRAPRGAAPGPRSSARGAASRALPPAGGRARPRPCLRRGPARGRRDERPRAGRACAATPGAALAGAGGARRGGRLRPRGHGRVHGRGRPAAALHAGVRQRRLQRDRGGHQHVRDSARGVLCADRGDRGHQVLSPVRRRAAPPAARGSLPDRLQQPGRHHLVAKPDHAGRGAVPQLHQPHAAPG